RNGGGGDGGKMDVLIERKVRCGREREWGVERNGRWDENCREGWSVCGIWCVRRSCVGGDVWVYVWMRVCIGGDFERFSARVECCVCGE
ncbi:hypothetical protein, partial [Bacillus altitudinis]|uniref:hypothetical protein n=1 Tax=Bacillus altitudinis TaxID=293387 RepID=UPI001C92ECE2